MIESYVGSKKYVIGGSPPRCKQGAILDGYLAQDDHGLGNRQRWPPRRGLGTDKEELEQQIRFVDCLPRRNHRASASLAAVSGRTWSSRPTKFADITSISPPRLGASRRRGGRGQVFHRPPREAHAGVLAALVEPNRSTADPSILVEPKTMRAYILNLGDRDATNVRVRLRNLRTKETRRFCRGRGFHRAQAGKRPGAPRDGGMEDLEDLGPGSRCPRLRSGRLPMVRSRQPPSGSCPNPKNRRAANAGR